MVVENVQTASNGLPIDATRFVDAYLAALDRDEIGAENHGFVPVWILARDLDVRCETLLAWIYRRGIHELRLQVTGARPYRALVKVCDGRGELLHAAGVLAVGIGAVVAAMGLLVLVAG